MGEEERREEERGEEAGVDLEAVNATLKYVVEVALTREKYERPILLYCAVCATSLALSTFGGDEEVLVFGGQVSRARIPPFFKTQRTIRAETKLVQPCFPQTTCLSRSNRMVMITTMMVTISQLLKHSIPVA